jgi:hypothetical protein
LSGFACFALAFGAFLTTGLSLAVGWSAGSASATPDKLLAMDNAIADAIHDAARMKPPLFHDKSACREHSSETGVLAPKFLALVAGGIRYGALLGRLPTMQDT